MPDPDHLKASLITECETSIHLMEQALTIRAQTIEAADRLKAKLESEKPLTSADLDLLNQGTVIHLDHRERLRPGHRAGAAFLDRNRTHRK